jgi:hypothetical protein
MVLVNTLDHVAAEDPFLLAQGEQVFTVVDRVLDS